MGSIDRDVYRAIAEQRGLHATSERMIEAMAELTQAITRFWRYDGINQVIIDDRRDRITEGIADVEIMLEQLKCVFECEKAAAQFKARKVEKELGRIIVENGKKLENKNSEHLSNENLRVE